MTESPPDIEAQSLDDPKRLFLRLLEEVASRKAENAALREEIARLKGLRSPPKLTPSGMATASEVKPVGAGGEGRRRGKTLRKLVITEVRT